MPVHRFAKNSRGRSNPPRNWAKKIPEYKEGVIAREKGQKHDANPYPAGSYNANVWSRGFLEASPVWGARRTKSTSPSLQPRGTRSNPPRASKASPNEHNVRELFLYITNDADLYRQRVGPIVKNLRLKVAKGKYDHDLAIKIYQYLADDGARKYMKEYGTTGDRVDSTFTKVDRTQCAKELRDYYDDEVRG